MSAPASEGATEGRQDDDDVLGFPGDGFVDNTDANPGVLGEQDEEGDDSRMDETGLFVLAPYGILSDKTQFPTVWACAWTKGCRKVYEKKGSCWSVIMDHLANVHDIEKETTHPTVISQQQKQARDESKKRALDAGMTEGRFQSICTTRYIIRRLLPFSHVECPEVRSTVHPAWKVIKVETQRNMVAEMYLCMVAAVKKTIADVIATSLLPPFWINADLWTSKVTKAKLYRIRIFFTQ